MYSDKLNDVNSSYVAERAYSKEEIEASNAKYAEEFLSGLSGWGDESEWATEAIKAMGYDPEQYRFTNLGGVGWTLQKKDENDNWVNQGEKDKYHQNEIAKIYGEWKTL